MRCENRRKSGRLERASLVRATALELKSFESLVGVDPLVKAGGDGKVVEPRFVTVNVAPPNKWMQLTVKSVTPFAKRRAKGAPLLPAADAGR